jgi:WD40 repeat protein/serine/threonine protein kinase
MAEPSQERERRLHEVLGAYFEAIEAGRAPRPQDLIAQNADLADDLASFFASNERFQRFLEPLQATVAETLTPGATAELAHPPRRPAPAADATTDADEHDSSSAPALPRGTQVRYFGDYELQTVLGEGGMGVVYRAKQVSLNRLVAVKMIRAGLWAGEDEVRRFKNEAEAVAGLDHPQIVPIYEIGSHDGQHYFSMKLVGEAGLATQLPRYAADPTAAARLVAEIARAVHHAHQRGILHRDLKPSNILLDAEGHPSVTDFGLAKKLGGNGELSVSGSILGTPAYMSPEQASGRRGSVTTATDVYGLGAILYTALTGRPPFQADDVLETLEQVRGRPPERPSVLNSRVDRDLETICLKCLEKDPKQRYDSASAVAGDLERYLRGEPILARRTGTWERLRKWSRRHPAAAALVGTSSIAALTLAGLGVSLLIHSQLRTAYAEVTRQRGIAEQQRGITEGALARELTFLYQNRIIFAERELNENNTYRAERLLDECPRDRRNWEWNYLQRQCHTELMTIQAHRSHVRSVAISRDGRLIATGAVNDGNVRLWDAEKGREVRPLPGHVEDAQVTCSFSRDGTHIASVGGSLNRHGKLLIHEVTTGRVVQSVSLGTGNNASVEFSPDGKDVVIASGDINTMVDAGVKRSGWVKICDAKSGQERRTLSTDGQPAISASYSPDGARVLAILGPTMPDDPSSEPNEIRAWDARTGMVRFKKRVPRGGFLMSASHSPDGRAIVTCGYDSTVKFLDADDGHERLVLRGHHGCTNSVAFSADGRHVASTSDDGSAKIWEVETGQELLTLRGHKGGFFGVRFSPDGRRLVTTGYDGTVKIWDATTDPRARTIIASDRIVWGLAFSRDSQRLVSGGHDGALKLWEASSGRLLKTWTPRHTSPVWNVAISTDGTRVASAAGDWTKANTFGEVNIWEIASGQLLYRLSAHRAIAWCVAFSPNGRWLVSGGGETRTPGQELIVWDISAGTRRRTISGLKAGVTAVAFSPDGRRIAAGVGDQVQVWDAETGDELAPFQGLESTVWGLAFSPDGEKLVSGCYHGTVRVWDFLTGRELHAFLADKSALSRLAIDFRGIRIASVGADPTVKLWDIETGQQLINIREDINSNIFLCGVAFSPDGHLIATSDSNGVVKLWDGSPLPGGTR